MSTAYGTPQRTRPSFGQGFVVMLGLVAVMWVLEGVDQATGNALDPFGIEPREPGSIDHVLWAPWLHGDFAHLASNSVPFLVLGTLVAMDGWRRWFATTAWVIAFSGGLVWLVSPANSITLGASGIVFGWLLYVMVRGVYTRKPGQIATGVVLFFFYGGLLWGVFPGTPGISWQAHLGGALGGVVAARSLRALQQLEPAPTRW